MINKNKGIILHYNKDNLNLKYRLNIQDINIV